jgi:uncharacterized HAD superfamily protein
VTRRLTYGVAASRIKPIASFFVVYSTIWWLYSRVWQVYGASAPDRMTLINAVTLVIVLGVMIAYRLVRSRHRHELKKRKDAGLVVGVDVDGVLADQITGVLPQIRERYGATLKYDEITEWRLPIGPTDIAKEIGLAHQDRKYVLGMRSHPGARKLLRFLYNNNRVLIVTARSVESSQWTRDWLNRRFLWYDGFETSTEARKSAHGTAVLIDDSLDNVVEFLENTAGVAVLVDQPWNRDRGALQPFVDGQRAFIVRRLGEIVLTWPTIVAAARRSQATVA